MKRMDSTANVLASGVGDADRGSHPEEDRANSADEDELIVDVVGECEDDCMSQERSAETAQSVAAQTEDTAAYSDSQSSCAEPTVSVEDAVVTNRNRRRISEEQRTVLWESFQQNSYPNREQHKLLAELLNLNEKRIKSWFQNHRTQLRRSGSMLESASPKAKLTSRVESPTTPKQGPSAMSIPRERAPVAAKEAPEMETGPKSRAATAHATDTAPGSITYKPMTQVSLSPNHPFYFLTDSSTDAPSRTVKTLKRKTPSSSTKTPSPKSSTLGVGERAFSEPCLRRRRMTPRQRREHRKLTLRLLAQSTTSPDQPLDLSMKPAGCDRVTPPATDTQTPSSDVYSPDRRRSALLPMVGRNSTDPCYYPVTMAMGLMPYIGVNYPHFQSLLGRQWPVHGQLKK